MKRTFQESQVLHQLLDSGGHIEIPQSGKMSLMPWVDLGEVGRQAAECPELLGSTLHARQSPYNCDGHLGQQSEHGR